MKTIFITGANKGIGFEMARKLALLGHRVVLGGRSKDRLEAARKRLLEKNIDVDYIEMDVNVPGSITHASEVFLSIFGELDVLINNAAVLLDQDKQLSLDPSDVFDQTFRTNVLGPLLVARAFIPLLNRPGRIINISSQGGSMTDSVGGWSPAYCASKTALNGITRQLAHELSSKQISVNAVHPGWVRTDMGGPSAARDVEKGAETPVWLAVTADQAKTGSFFMDKKEIPW